MMGVLIAGIGNLFHSDDGFGCEVARRLVAEPLPESVRVVDYGIRGIHLAYDLLEGYDALVIIDAIPRGDAPGEVTVLEVGPDDIGEAAFDAHGMNPVAVLGTLGDLGGTLPPTYVVGCRPASIEEGIGLSEPVEAAIPVALAEIRALFDRLCADLDVRTTAGRR